MKHRIIAITLLCTSLTGAACAQTSAPDQPRPDQPKPERHAMRHGDANGDGVVSRAEFLADAARRFDMMDTNKDGQLSADERKAARDARRAERPGTFAGDFGGPPPGAGPGVPPPPPPGAGALGPGGGGGGMLARLDANGDDKITRAEFDAPFDRLDVNKDGVIDDAERAAIPQGGPGGGRMARLDRDGDGKITRAEFEAPFARLDANGDGVIDAAELQAVRARLGGGRRFGGQGPRQSEAELQPQ